MATPFRQPVADYLYLAPVAVVSLWARLLGLAVVSAGWVAVAPRGIVSRCQLLGFGEGGGPPRPPPCKHFRITIHLQVLIPSQYQLLPSRTASGS